MKRFFPVLVLIFVLMMIPLAHAVITYGSNHFTISDNVNYVMSGVIATGGDMTLTGEGYKASVVVGQPAIGHVESDGYLMDLGFFFGEIGTDMTTIRINGNLRYNNGLIVSDADVRGVVSKDSEVYEDSTTTDENGYFELSIAVPEYFMTYDFKLQVFVTGEIESMYECYYCPDPDSPDYGSCSSNSCLGS